MTMRGATNQVVDHCMIAMIIKINITVIVKLGKIESLLVKQEIAPYGSEAGNRPLMCGGG